MLKLCRKTCKLALASSPALETARGGCSLKLKSVTTLKAVHVIRRFARETVQGKKLIEWIFTMVLSAFAAVAVNLSFGDVV